MVDENVRRAAFCGAVIRALQLLRSVESDGRFQPANRRNIINPGGPSIARHVAERLLDAPGRQFYDLFRMDKATFRLLVNWLRRAGLAGTQYQSVEQKVLIFLYILAHNSSQR